MAARVERAGRDVFHVTGYAVNWTLVREGRELTLIDAGFPGDRAALEESVSRIGHTMDDLRGVLITHCHIDHVGTASGLARQYRIPVYVHASELPLAQGERREQAAPIDVIRRAWQPRFARWGVELLRLGGARHPTVPEAEPLPTDGPLDLPGRPTPLPCGGHTSGHCAYLLPQDGAVVSGDALVTAHPTSRRTGPQLLDAYFAHSPHDTLDSLDVIGGADAHVLLPGHGPSWRGDLRLAVATARDHAPAGYR